MWTKSVRESTLDVPISGSIVGEKDTHPVKIRFGCWQTNSRISRLEPYA